MFSPVSPSFPSLSPGKTEKRSKKLPRSFSQPTLAVCVRIVAKYWVIFKNVISRQDDVHCLNDTLQLCRNPPTATVQESPPNTLRRSYVIDVHYNNDCVTVFLSYV